MNKPHKHIELIKAWADGSEIEVLTDDLGKDGEVGNSWKYTSQPLWYEHYFYRIKPTFTPIIFRCFLQKAESEKEEPQLKIIVLKDFTNSKNIPGFIHWFGYWQEHVINNTSYKKK